MPSNLISTLDLGPRRALTGDPRPVRGMAAQPPWVIFCLEVR